MHAPLPGVITGGPSALSLVSFGRCALPTRYDLCLSAWTVGLAFVGIFSLKLG